MQKVLVHLRSSGDEWNFNFGALNLYFSKLKSSLYFQEQYTEQTEWNYFQRELWKKYFFWVKLPLNFRALQLSKLFFLNSLSCGKSGNFYNLESLIIYSFCSFK